MIPLGEKSKREQMILEAKINREHMKMGLEEGRKDEEHDFSLKEKEMKLKEQEIKLQKAQQELEAKYQEMMLKRADLEFKSEIERTKLKMEMQKTEAEIQMDVADRQMQSQREDDAHNVKMSHENNKNQLDLHKRAGDAHMNQQLKYHSAKAKAKSDPEAPHDVPELDLREIPKPKAFKQGTPSVFNPGVSAYEKGTKSVMTNVPMPNIKMTQGLHHGGIAEEKVLGGMGARMAEHPPVPQGYWLGIDEVVPNKNVQSQIVKRTDAQGKVVPNNYVLTNPKPTQPVPTQGVGNTLSNTMSPQARWEQQQKAKRGYAAGGQVSDSNGSIVLSNRGPGSTVDQWGFNHGGNAPAHPLTGKQPTNPEAGPSDTVPAMLTPGEAVIPREAAQNPKNKPIIDKLIAEGRHVQKFGSGTHGVRGYAVGAHHVQGYVAGTQNVADTDVYWTNQGESATNQQTEEERKRRMEQQVKPVQNEDGSSQGMGVPPVQATPENTSVEFSSQKVERPTHSEAVPDRDDTAQQTADQRFDQRVADEEKAMGEIPKPEEGWGSKIDKTLNTAGSVFGLNSDEMKRMAAQAVGAKLLGYNTRTAVGAGFKGAMHQADQRAQRKHQQDVIDQQDRRLEAKETAALKAAEVKSQKDAYQGAYKEEYARLTKEEYLPEHEARAKADAYAKGLVTGKVAPASAEGGPQVSSGPRAREGVYNGQRLVGEWAHAPSKPGNDFVVTDKNGATKQVPTHVVKVRGVDTPFVNVQADDGSYRQIPLQEYKEKTLNAGYGIHEMSQADTVQSRQRQQEEKARANQSAAIQLAGHKMSVESHNRAAQSHAVSMDAAGRAREDHAIKTIKANLPDYIAGTDEKSKGNPQNQVNKDKIANASLLAAREMKIDPNNPAFVRMNEQAAQLITMDSNLAKTVSPEGYRKLLQTTVVSGLPDGGHLVQPVLPKGVDKITPELATKAAAAQIKFGERLSMAQVGKDGKTKSLDEAFNILREDYNKLAPAEKKKWEARAEGSGQTPFMFRVNNL